MVPIIVKADNNEHSGDNEQSGDGEYSDDEDYNKEQSGDGDYNNNVNTEEPSKPQVWKWMAAVTEKTCEANDGFVCKVRLCVQHDNDDGNELLSQ